MLAYFRQRYGSRVEIDSDGEIQNIPLKEPMEVEQLHLALSDDGRHWTALNGNLPIWEQRLRDPFVKRAPDGRWHLLGTGRAANSKRGGERPLCLHAVSEDLIHWKNTESLPLMKGIRDADGRPSRNIWAPEWFFDDTTGDYLLIWSSSFEDAGWKKSRLWFSRTRDWKSFTPAEVIFDPPYSVIDGSLLKQDETYYLFHKEEEFGAKTGERRAIRVAISKTLTGPYEIQEGHLNKGQIVPTITEGCAVMPDPKQAGWLLLYDYCMTNRYGASSSKNLLDWQVEDDVRFPPDARHGSVSKLTEDEAKALQKAFPAEPD